MRRRLLCSAVLLIVAVSAVSAVSTDWFRNTLDADRRALYDRIGNAVLNCHDSVEGIEYDLEECQRIYSGYLDDHPGIFWVEPGIAYRTATIGNRKANSVVFKYTHQDNLAADQKTFIKLVDQFSENLKKYDNDWIKLYHIFSYLSKTITYSLDYMDQSMWSVFFDGIGVCAGFARSFQYLALLEGIPSVVVHGWGKNADGTKGESHLWVMAKIDDTWYHFDPTWGKSDDDNGVKYTYFCRSQERIEKTHIIDMRYPIPAANDDTMSYASIRHRYIEKYSAEGFAKILADAIIRGDMSFTVEFSNLSEMTKAYEDLFVNRSFLNMINGMGDTGILSYNHLEDKNALTMKIMMI